MGNHSLLKICQNSMEYNSIKRLYRPNPLPHVFIGAYYHFQSQQWKYLDGNKIEEDDQKIK